MIVTSGTGKRQVVAGGTTHFHSSDRPASEDYKLKRVNANLLHEYHLAG